MPADRLTLIFFHSSGITDYNKLDPTLFLRMTKVKLRDKYHSMLTYNLIYSKRCQFIAPLLEFDSPTKIYDSLLETTYGDL